MPVLGENVRTSSDAAETRQVAQSLGDMTKGAPRAVSYTSEQRNDTGWSRWVQFTVGRGRRIR